MEDLVGKLHRERRLGACEYRSLLLCEDPQTVGRLHERARQTAVERFGRDIYIRGLIEISNICRNDCLYCGIRKSNRAVSRYTLTEEEIMECCHLGYGLGFRTFVLQGGEPPQGQDSRIEAICRAIHREFPDCAITLSIGERTEEAYRRFRQAGVSRYLLRHETHDPGHYARLHPPGMSLENRLRCLDTLKRYGYQTGTGIMVGSPFQSIDSIIGSDIAMCLDVCTPPGISHRQASSSSQASSASSPQTSFPATVTGLSTSTHRSSPPSAATASTDCESTRPHWSVE